MLTSDSEEDSIDSMTNQEEIVRRRQELRRSNAAAPHRNKKKYNRTVKHRKNKYDDN